MNNTGRVFTGIGFVAAGVGAFLTFRYFRFGKGNKDLLCPTLFGYGGIPQTDPISGAWKPPMDEACLTEQETAYEAVYSPYEDEFDFRF